MAKKQSSKKPKPSKLKPKTEKSEPEKVRIGPLDPPPPEGGGETATGGDYKDT
jgi:hypothetical protein